MHCSPVRGLQLERRVMQFRPGMCQHGVSRMHSKLNPASSRVMCGPASSSVILQLKGEIEDRCLATVRDALQLLGHLPPVKGLDVVLCGTPHSSAELGAGWQDVNASDTQAVTAGREAQVLHAVEDQPNHNRQNTQATNCRQVAAAHADNVALHMRLS